MKQLHKNTNERTVTRVRRQARIRKKFIKTRNEHPRLTVFRSNRFLYAQLVDDATGKTLAQANTKEKTFESLKSKKSLEAAAALGKELATRIQKLDPKVENLVFDRSGYNFHGRIKAIADGAREVAKEAGINF